MTLQLRTIVLSPSGQKPKGNWAEIATELNIPATLPKLRNAAGRIVDLDPAKLLKAVGSAVIDARLSQNAKKPLDAKAKRIIVHIVNAILDKVSTLNSPLSTENLNDVVEQSIFSGKEFLALKAYILFRTTKQTHRHRVSTLQVIRRNDQVVPWIPTKIEVAVRKAFLSKNQDSSPAEGITEKVVAKVLDMGVTEIHIEAIQDIVVGTLFSNGYTEVAEGYAEYRDEKAKEREAKQKDLLNLDPTLIDETLVKRIDFAISGLSLPFNREEIAKRLVKSMNANFSEADKRTTISLNSKAFVELDPGFAYFAGRITLSYVYEEALDWKITDGIEKLKEAHKVGFKKYIHHGIALGRLDPRLAEFNLDILGEALDPLADLQFDVLGITTLYDRYLIHENKKRLETPQFFWMRVAMGLALGEKQDKEEHAIGAYELYRTKRFCSSTPTLFNAGTVHPQLSSCYLVYVPDTMEGIFHHGIADGALLSKWAGGLGYAWTAVRGTGGYIKGTNGESQGVIPFLKVFNDTLVSANQGGKRKGAGCGYLETWHCDIEEFLELRKNVGDDRRRCHDMNTANWIPDLFMQRIQAGHDWSLFRSNEVSDLNDTYGRKFKERYEHYEKLADEGKIFRKKITARSLWKKMLEAIFETGHPWITFKDPCNVRSPQDHAGVVHSSNLCTEITLNTNADETAVCNLGSINLPAHIKENGEVNWDLLRSTVKTAVRLLDCVIDINFYPTAAAKTANTRHRPVGLGVMGLQDVLHKKGIPFASEANVELNGELMEFIAFHAYLASSKLAKEKGAYSSYKGSKWSRNILPQDTVKLLEEERGESTGISTVGKLDWTEVRESIKENGMRNSNVLAIAPTATISNIVGVTECIQPDYKNLYAKSNLSGEFISINSYLIGKLKEFGIWDSQMLADLKYYDGELTNIDRIPAEIKNQFKTVFEIDSKWVIEAAARRGVWIDQSQSLNLYLGTPDAKKLSNTYIDAWKKGLKTTYYLRTLSASAVQKATTEVRIDAVKAGKDIPEICESCQ